MKKIIITPSKLRGEVKIPSSKSLAHRAIICASLSRGKSRITNINFSEDILATIDAMRILGTEINIFESCLEIDGRSTFSKNSGIINCKESGSTLRFLIPLTLVRGREFNFIGNGNLGSRPLSIYYEIFDKQGIEYGLGEGVFDLKIKGKMMGGDFKIRGDISSQFISGLLFSLPLLEEDSKISITTPLESRSYIDLTLSMLKLYGIEVINRGYREFIVKGNQKYRPQDYRVEGDFSQAAFFLTADALGSDVLIKNLNKFSLQGDKDVLNILSRMGGNIEENSNGVKIREGNLIGTIIDASQCPDIIPVLTVAAAIAKGETRIINAERLRIKECDRLKAITTEINKLGAKITEYRDSISIEGVDYLRGGSVHSWNDHRIAMSLAIAATCSSEEVILKNPDCVKKSYPNFWEDYKKLGGKICEWSLG